MSTPQPLGPPSQFGAFTTLYLSDLLAGESRVAEDHVVDHLDAIFADRAESEFRLVRDTEFTNYDHVQWYVQHPRDLVGHGNTATRQAHHDNILVPQVLQPFRQATPGVTAIIEKHRGPPLESSVAFLTS